MSALLDAAVRGLRAPLAWGLPERPAHFYSRCVHRLFRERRAAVHLPTAFGAPMTLTGCDFVQRHIMLHEIWEPAVSYWIFATLKPGDHFVDVGSNVGYYALLASTLVGPTGRVTAIEPTPPVFARLAAHCEGRKNVTLVNEASSDTVGRLRLYQAPGSNSGLSSAIRLSDAVAEFDVAMRPLDDVLVKPVTTIKIDVEGAEGKVILGAMQTLRDQRPDLVVEINKERFAALGTSAEETFATLRGLGYHAYRLDNRYLIREYLRSTPIEAPVLVESLSDAQDDLLFTRRTPDDVAALYRGVTVGGFLAALRNRE